MSSFQYKSIRALREGDAVYRYIDIRVDRTQYAEPFSTRKKGIIIGREEGCLLVSWLNGDVEKIDDTKDIMVMIDA